MTYKKLKNNDNYIFEDVSKERIDPKHVLFVIFLLFLGIIMGWVAYASARHYLWSLEQYQLRRQFDEYIVRYNKSYSRDSSEYKVRFQFYKESLEEIGRLNRESAGPEAVRARYRINRFSDQHATEFAKRHLTAEPSRFGYRALPEICENNAGPLSEKFYDWRAHDAVGPVQQQGSCGACWAFSAVGVIESHISITRGVKPPPSLSVQQVIDCVKEGNNGCEGGQPAEAMSLMARRHVVMMSAADYPLAYADQECKRVSLKPGYMLNNLDIRGSCVGREEAMAKRVAEHGPVAVSVNAITWQHYDDGVIQNNCGGKSEQELNHAVQVVGYDAYAEVPYYIVKNSWGDDWNSLGGYAYVAMYQNECGIAWHVSQPQSVCWASADQECE